MVECLAVPLQVLVAAGFLVAECLVAPLRVLVVVAFLAAECQNPVCLAVLSLVLVKILVEFDLAAHKMSRVQLEL